MWLYNTDNHLMELCKILVLQLFLEAFEVGEITRGNLMLSLELSKNLWQFVDKFFLLGVLAKHRGHFLFELSDDVRLHLKKMNDYGLFKHLQYIWELTHYSIPHGPRQIWLHP